MGAGMVYLNVYDLNEDWLQTNNLFHDVLKIGGAFHAGIEVYGREWSFGREGISSAEPRTHEVHVYRQTIKMGTTQLGPEEIVRLIQTEAMPLWEGSSYDILRRNCCNFADFLCRYLVQKRIPKWVQRLPKAASAARKSLGNALDMGGSVAASNASSCARGCSVGSVNASRSPQYLARTRSFDSDASSTTADSAASDDSSDDEDLSPCYRVQRGWTEDIFVGEVDALSRRYA